MKRILVLVTLLVLSFSLTGCIPEPIDYTTHLDAIAEDIKTIEILEVEVPVIVKEIEIVEVPVIITEIEIVKFETN